MSGLTAVLFDFGGVFTLSPFGAVTELAEERGHDPMLFAEQVFGPYHQDTDHPWHQLERGEIALEACRDAIIERSRKNKCEVDLWDVFGKIASANGGQVVNPQVVKLLEEVKQQGFHTAIVTNNVKEFDGWQAMIPIEHVDVVVDSAFVNVRKPSLEIYNIALDRLGAHHGISLDPQHCIFLDDVESNVEAARKAGLQGLHVTDNPDETVANLWARLRS